MEGDVQVDVPIVLVDGTLYILADTHIRSIVPSRSGSGSGSGSGSVTLSPYSATFIGNTTQTVAATIAVPIHMLSAVVLARPSTLIVSGGGTCTLNCAITIGEGAELGVQFAAFVMTNTTSNSSITGLGTVRVYDDGAVYPPADLDSPNITIIISEGGFLLIPSMSSSSSYPSLYTTTATVIIEKEGSILLDTPNNTNTDTDSSANVPTLTLTSLELQVGGTISLSSSLSTMVLTGVARFLGGTIVGPGRVNITSTGTAVIQSGDTVGNANTVYSHRAEYDASLNALPVANGTILTIIQSKITSFGTIIAVNGTTHFARHAVLLNYGVLAIGGGSTWEEGDALYTFQEDTQFGYGVGFYNFPIGGGKSLYNIATASECAQQCLVADMKVTTKEWSGRSRTAVSLPCLSFAYRFLSFFLA